MDRKYSWKRTEDRETDLAELLASLCGQWKRIAFCALVSAAVLGGYGWNKGREEPDSGVQSTEEIELTEEEEQSVADTLQLAVETRQLEEYLDHSVLMQLDPYHKARYIMLYSVDLADRHEMPKITESYLNFILNGGAADRLKESWKLDKNYLAEVVSAYQKTYASPLQVTVDSQADGSQTSESLFYVEITGRDIGESEKMARDLQNVLKDYSAEVKKKAGSHRIELVSSTGNITADSGLQSLQHDRKTALSSNRTNLKAATDAFSRQQKSAYKEAWKQIYEDDQEEAGTDTPDETLSDEAVPDEIAGAFLKYVLLGLLGGGFAYCCVFACGYILNDAVRSTGELKRLYTFPVYGGILLQAEKSSKVRLRVNQDAYGSSEEQVANRIRLSCMKQGISKLCGACDFPLSAPEKECLENMAGQLKESEIEMTVAENANVDTSAWDGIAETGNILLVCREGVTTHRMIEDAMNFYLENGIAVAGAVVFLQ